MSKAILVIDMPDSCWNCSLIIKKENGCKVCPVTNCTLISRDGKFTWCPLKPMPEKRNVNDIWTMGGCIGDDYSVGWNTCINEILDA